jgi:hypothetical protein
MLLCLPMALKAEEPEFWQTILQEVGKVNKTTFRLRQQYRFAFDEFKLVDGRYSLESTTPLNKIWNLGVNFTYINNRRFDENPFTQRFRWEFELNPHLKLSKNTELRLRNRYEFLKDEYEPQWYQIFRQRQQLIMKVDYRSLRSITASNEFFYNLTLKKWDQIRLIPLELNFKVGKDHTYKLFVMIRWLRPNESWDPQFVLGSTIDW